MMRVGIGFDIHRMVAGRRCVIGGVEIPHSHGLLGHSDGDVLLHALVDAILGAAALGDIGEMFPDTDPKYKDADSRLFVEGALQRVREKGFEVTSIDSVVLADSPKIAQYRETICENIASMLSLESDCVSVKGKTFEGLGAVGRGEAIAAQVVVVLREKREISE
jgi:2-C-methyl-D-erythritol 2,4-cyclodiphosphate synthase